MENPERLQTHDHHGARHQAPEAGDDGRDHGRHEIAALDAAAQGFSTTVRLDACRGIDLGGSMATMLGRMKEAGVTLD